MNSDLGEHYRVIKLFFILPLYGWNTKGGNKTWRILGIPVFKKKAKINGANVTYCFLGIPIVKISKKLV